MTEMEIPTLKRSVEENNMQTLPAPVPWLVIDQVYIKICMYAYISKSGFSLGMISLFVSDQALMVLQFVSQC
jgi:hypothetical protein